MARAWYSYTRIGDPTLPENYFYSMAKPTCNAGRVICSIYVPYWGSNPAYISYNIRAYIAMGQVTGLAQPSSPIIAKKYVYLMPL